MATTSGSSGFNLDLTELVEEAFERAGSELRTGYDLKTARRSLNLLFADWANRGVNMWTFEQKTITLVQGQPTYALPDDTVDLLRPDDAHALENKHEESPAVRAEVGVDYVRSTFDGRSDRPPLWHRIKLGGALARGGDNGPAVRAKGELLAVAALIGDGRPKLARSRIPDPNFFPPRGGEPLPVGT